MWRENEIDGTAPRGSCLSQSLRESEVRELIRDEENLGETDELGRKPMRINEGALRKFVQTHEDDRVSTRGTFDKAHQLLDIPIL